MKYFDVTYKVAKQYEVILKEKQLRQIKAWYEIKKVDGPMSAESEAVLKEILDKGKIFKKVLDKKNRRSSVPQIFTRDQISCYLYSMNKQAVIIKMAVNAAINLVRRAYWAYCNPSKALRIILWGTAVACSLFTARALLILNGVALMGAAIFILMHTIGSNIDHTIFVLLPCFIVAHLIGHYTDIHCTSRGLFGHLSLIICDN